MSADELSRIDLYLDRAPRAASRTEEVGPFTLFVGQGPGWHYYSRPNVSHVGVITSEDVVRVVDRQRELEVPESIEGLADITPSLVSACHEAGLRVEELPLLVYRPGQPAPVPENARIRRVPPDDRAVPASRAVAHLAFEHSGTAVSAVGVAQRDEALRTGDGDADDVVRSRIKQGLSVLFVAEDDSGVVASGIHQPVGDVSEIVGVATLPAKRRQGLAGALTADLVSDALKRGVSLCFLTAGSTEIARVYERVGFRRVGTAIAANRPSG